MKIFLFAFLLFIVALFLTGHVVADITVVYGSRREKITTDTDINLETLLLRLTYSPSEYNFFYLIGKDSSKFIRWVEVVRRSKEGNPVIVPDGIMVTVDCKLTLDEIKKLDSISDGKVNQTTTKSTLPSVDAPSASNSSGGRNAFLVVFGGIILIIFSIFVFKKR